MAPRDFETLMAEASAALDEIANGSADGYKALFSRREDITLGNPFGGFARGREQVEEQLERAASSYRDGSPATFETVTRTVTPELAYTVEIERFSARVAGQPERADVALRVTCIYRLEEDGWKLVHRHADPRVSRQAADSILDERERVPIPAQATPVDR